MRTPEAAPVSCCSAFYEQDWVRTLAQDSFHPGGADLTRRTVAAMNLSPGARLLDLGCGSGSTAILLAKECGLRVTGLDRSADNVRRAQDRAREALGAASEPQFLCGNAESPPFAAASFDGVLAECVLSLLPDQVAALAAARRLLTPERGRLAFTDMAIGPGLDPALAEAMAPWTCLAGAKDEGGLRRQCVEAGFAVEALVDESAGLTSMVRRLKRRLLLVGAGEAFAGEGLSLPFDLATAKEWLDRFQRAVDDGAVRYLRLQLVP